MTTTRYLDRDGARLAYDLTLPTASPAADPATAPLAVCVPGMGDLRSTFRHLVPALAAAGLRVATLDLRGHGDSDTTFDAFDDVAAGGDALALVEHLGGPAVLVGNSMGAGAAVWAVAERPDLVVGLALTGPFVRDPAAGLTAAAMRLVMRLILLRPWGPAAWRSYLASLYPGGFDADTAAHAEAIRAALRRPGRWRAFQRTTRTTHEPARARLARVKVPTLLVMGSRDRDWSDPVREVNEIAALLGGTDGPADQVEVLVVEGAGHYPHSQAPAACVPAIVELARRGHARG